MKPQLLPLLLLLLLAALCLCAQACPDEPTEGKEEPRSVIRCEAEIPPDEERPHPSEPGMTIKRIQGVEYLCVSKFSTCYPLVFEPTDEFQEVQPGQQFPRGLHVRMNFETGRSEAKLMEREQKAGEKAEEKAEEKARSELNIVAERQETAVIEVKAEGGEQDGGGDEPLPVLTPERLEELKEMWDIIMEAADKEPSLLRDCVRTLKNASSTVEQLTEALEELEPIVRQFDNGKDFVSMGAMPSLVRLLSNPDSEIRARAAMVLGATLQSNLGVQVHCHEDLKLVPKLFQLLKEEESSLTKKRLLSAFSSLVRGYPDAARVVLEQGYLHEMSNLFENSSDETFKKRCATLVGDLVAEEIAREPADNGHSVYDQISHNWWCPHFADLLMSEDFDSMEKGLRAVEITIPACTKDSKVTQGLEKARSNLNTRTDLDPEYKAQLQELLENIEIERERHRSISKC